jgi:type I restriction enzyme S subunit
MPETPLLDIRPDHLRMVKDILQKHVPRYEVWAFGSRARRTAKPHSDLDLCVVSDKPLGYAVLGALAEDFSDSDLPWKVDVVDWAATSESFRKIIERDKVVIQEAKRGGGVEGKAMIECTVGEIAAPIRNALVGGPFGSDLVSRDYVTRGVPVIRGTNMGHGRWVGGEFAYVTPEKANSLASNCAKPGDLVFTQRGTLGQVALVPQMGAERYLISQSQMKLTVDADKADSLFLYYVFNSAEQQEYIRQNAIQTGVPHTNLGILRNAPLTLPSFLEQKAIAHILGTLDDKIELNRRMNATLEAMARALFQSWFVDFDPVRAKLDGRQPAGLDAATAALFPAHFQESPLGHIPQGWDVLSLDQVADYLNGLALQKYPPGDGETLPVIKIAQLRKGDSEGADRCNTELAPQYIVEDGDVLFSWSGSLEVELWCGGRGALNQHLFKVTSSDFPKWFYYLWTLYHLDEFRLIAADKATTMGHIQRGHLTAAKVLVPPPVLLESMTRIMAPLIDQIIANRAQSRTLATLRDALLPKLLSGELNIAEQQLAHL